MKRFSFTAIAFFSLSGAFGLTIAEERATTLAFPGAQGHGAWAVGGRGGKIVHVTTLNKRGPGSFAWAVNELKEPRTIVFDVSGVIDCNDEIGFEITSENDHVTIAGETSPHGIAVYNYRRFDVSGEEIIMRFLRFRGTRIHTKNDPDALLIRDAKNVIVDHCSFAGACDETINTVRSKNVTIQWTGYDASRKAESHADFFTNNGQWHNYGSLHTHSTTVTIHHCLFAHHSKRCPLTDEFSDIEAINNVIYNYSNSQQTWGAEGEGLKIVNCYFKLGPDRRKNPIPVRPNARLVLGCLSRDMHGNDGPSIPDQGERGELSLNDLDSADEAYARVIKLSGALPHDATSRSMVEDTVSGTGKQGYVDRIEADRAALSQPADLVVDSDVDGLPDAWEISHGSAPNDPNDATNLLDSGYTAIEDYCHELAAKQIVHASNKPTLNR